MKNLLGKEKRKDGQVPWLALPCLAFAWMVWRQQKAKLLNQLAVGYTEKNQLVLWIGCCLPAGFWYLGLDSIV